MIKIHIFINNNKNKKNKLFNLILINFKRDKK